MCKKGHFGLRTECSQNLRGQKEPVPMYPKWEEITICLNLRQIKHQE